MAERPGTNIPSKEGPASTAASAGTATPATNAPAASTATAPEADAASATTTAKPAAAPAPPVEGSLDISVMEYLRKKGMESAASELSKILKQEKEGTTGTAADKDKGDEETAGGGGDTEDRTGILSKATGGGFGYDRDASAPVAHWGVPDTTKLAKLAKSEDGHVMGVEEARALLDSFTSFQLWVLGLPDQDGVQSAAENVIFKAKELLKKGKTATSLSSVVEVLSSNNNSNNKEQQNANTKTDKTHDKASYFHLPPSVKPELFAVAFALMVHTYCELLEVGMESTAHILRDTFHKIYEPFYGKELVDLFQCVTTEDMIRLNSHNQQHMEAVSNSKAILVQVANYSMKREELRNAAASSGAPMDDPSQAAKQAKLQEYDRTIAVLQQKYNELSQRASIAFNKMHDLPFLRRARAVRWQLSLSTTTYGLLSSFLNAHDASLLAMNTLLQTKCELHVERRDPLPFTPACVLDDNLEVDGETTLKLNTSQIGWASPMMHSDPDSSKSKLAFPKFQMAAEYKDEKEAQKEKHLVEFNRALLVNGFRRLESLERRQQYEVLPELKIAKKDHQGHFQRRESANPLEPTVLMSTICCNTGMLNSRRSAAQASSSSSGRNSSNFIDKTTAIWEEAGIGLCCAKICPPDGRQVAVGCDDAAVRIWNHKVGDSAGDEPEQVLLGHKNGFPVFDVSWNRDGRTLLSAAGDGTVRLWDTLAVGNFGAPAAVESSSLSSPKGKSSPASKTNTSTSQLEGMNVPNAKKDDSEYVSGAALAVYRGHAPSTPIWSVSFSPCGYYFATAGADATVRLWTTDREAPVRLFTGHTSMIVNCVDWNPNCNYIISGSEDKTARLWDIHSGRTVRLLNGCSVGVTGVKISPCGKYAAGSDAGGSVHLWDVGTGKKVTEFRSKPTTEKVDKAGTSMVHAMSFSACGSGLAVGGDNCCVKIWDVRREKLENPVGETPAKTFPTRQTMIMDLKFTNRNLLLSVGKYIAPVPTPVMIAD